MSSCPPRRADVRNHRRPAGVSAAPRAARVEQNPMPVRRAQRDRVALPDVDHVELDIARATAPAASTRAPRPTTSAPSAGRMPFARRARDDHRTPTSRTRRRSRRTRRRDRRWRRAESPRPSTRRVRDRPAADAPRRRTRRATGPIGASTSPQKIIGCASSMQRIRREIRQRSRRRSRGRRPTRRSAPTRSSRSSCRAASPRRRSARREAVDRTPIRLPSRAAEIIATTPTTLSW